MARREFQFISGGSSKFWAIDLGTTSFDVTFGKIGTPGTTQTKSFDDAASAKKMHDKLVLEKTSKGYVEVGSKAAAPATETKKATSGTKSKSTEVETEPLNEMYFSTTKNLEDMEAIKSFIGLKVANYTSPKSIKKGNGHVYRFAVSYDDEESDDKIPDYAGRLKSFFASDAALSARGLILGSWCMDDPEPVDEAIKVLLAHKDRLPELAALFIGDICQEENEISWIEQTNLTPVLEAFPKLEMLRVRGGTELGFPKAGHKKLRALGLETGGLAREVVAEICQGKFPNLEYLELWLGDSGYGGNTQVADLQPIFKGKAFPKLKYLGLRNSEITDDIAGVIISSPIMKQLETLDLSLGTLSDEGGTALLKLPQDGKLQRLDLHRHFLTAPMVKQLKKLPFTTNLTDQQKPDDWGDGERRFVAIGE